ncbi:PAS domain-containing protein [Vreelandella rituensis]|nr:PAS domain-containing protein [Halomonas rituensis]
MESHQYYNELMECLPTPLLQQEIDSQGDARFVSANRAALELLGMTDARQLIGKRPQDISPACQPDGECSQGKSRRLLAELPTTLTTPFEWVHSRTDGKAVIVKVSLLVLDSHEEGRVVVTWHDITEYKHTLQALSEQREALENILWGTGAGTWEWNVQTGETRFNERWAEMVGYSLASLEPTTIDTWMALAHPDDLKQSERALTEHFSGEKPSYDLEARMRHRDGHWIWVQDRGKVVSRTPEGEPLWVVGTHSDITERKEAEFIASELTERLKKLAALLPGTLYQYHQWPDGRSAFPYSSAGIKHIYGASSEDVKTDASPIFEVIHPEDFSLVVGSIEASEHKLTTWRQRFRVNHPQRGLRWLEGTATPERLDDESTIWHGYIHDISDVKQAEDALDVYRDSLERSNKELEHFAYAASHDLRQPLRMVTSYSQLLERHLGADLDEHTDTMLHFMKDGAKRMDQMLVSLLEYSRVGRKGQPMNWMDSREALEEALRFLQPDIEETGAKLSIEGQWPKIYASPDEMTRLFQNLVGNALKYRKADNTIEICLEAGGDAQKSRFSVRDNGIGIAPEHTDRLFKVFQRLHTREQYEGAGVGLAICRKIVERHGGTIWVESGGNGRGSSFNFTLALRGPQEPSS